ncbi:sensor histidine kinase [Dyadobacter sp. CY356]|uniref:sensor histidine kinase n=1 Tax=Dyadobacter sp. CY356 TaxID=2906442 RepID=UPI001F2220D4|nr:histidine kinase [Dyadobacter sp. CY356]MCF0057131.1 histidine kinase [Dyadobacter sp. CY356]
MLNLELLADPVHYKGWKRVGVHLLLILGIFLLVISTYIPWFLYPNPALNYPFITYAGPVLRDSLSIILQYYLLVYLFSNYWKKPFILILGLCAYYVILFSFYYYASHVVKYYFGLSDDYTGSINHFEKMSYLKALFHIGTFYHLLFIIERAFYPLAVKLLVEIYRRQVRNVRLQQQYTSLELDFLKSQLNPHFLFNVLNSIYALTEEESPRAAQIVERLSTMMRYSLYETADALVPLNKELLFIRDYVDLELLRSAKRLQLKTEYPVEVDETLQIAPFILITFIENSFKHGVQSTAQKSWITIKIIIDDYYLSLHISNSKPAKPLDGLGGLGLSNVKKRLAILYPGHKLIIKEDLIQYEVKLQLPLHNK